MSGEPPQRLRIVFAKCGDVKYTSHLDLVRVWERALRRAGLPLAYSHGFNPRPKLFFAAALPVGFTGRAEVMDAVLQRRMGLREFASQVRQQLPVGLRLVSTLEVPTTLPPLPTRVTAAEYEVVVESQDTPEAMRARLNDVMAAESIVRRRERPRKVQVYDLRPLVKKMWVEGRRGDMYAIRMYLQADEQGTGRPDEVMAAMGMERAVCSVERVRLILRDD